MVTPLGNWVLKVHSFVLLFLGSTTSPVSPRQPISHPAISITPPKPVSHAPEAAVVTRTPPQHRPRPQPTFHLDSDSDRENQNLPFFHHQPVIHRGIFFQIIFRTSPRAKFHRYACSPTKLSPRGSQPSTKLLL